MTTKTTAVVSLAPHGNSSTLCYVSAKDYQRYWLNDVRPEPMKIVKRPEQLPLPFGDPPCITPTS
jgi:hypothetical protein